MIDLELVAVRPANSRRDLAILFLATLIVTAPFVGQAFHLDDEVYLRIARELVHSPAGLGLREQPLFGVPQPLVDHTQHPPLTIIFLALLTWLFGGAREVPFHVAYAGFAFLAVFGLYRLLAGWTPRAREICLLIVLAPPFAVSAHTLMTDVPFLAFFALALEGYWRLLQGEDAAATRAALLASLCALTQYRGLLLPVVVLGGAWLAGRLSRRLLLASVVPLVVLAGYELLAGSLWGFSPFLHASGFLKTEPRRWLLATVTYLASLGGCYVFLVLAALGRIPWRRVLVALAVGAVAVLSHRRQVDVPNLIAGLVFAAAGMLLLWDMVRAAAGCVRILLQSRRPMSPELPGLGCAAQEGRPGEGSALTSLLGLVVLASLVFLGLFACVRNLLVLLPFALVAFDAATPGMLRGRRLVAVLSLTAALALACSVSDCSWAGAYRAHASRYVGEPHVYFTGEWGFRYYMERAGAQYLLAGATDVPAGAILVRPAVAAPENRISPVLAARLEHAGTVEVRNAIPLLLMAEPQRNCGWYSEGYGILPFCIGSRRQERLSRERVRP